MRAKRAALERTERQEEETERKHLNAMQHMLASMNSMHPPIEAPYFDANIVAHCPGCSYILTRADVQESFSADPAEFRACCPACGALFMAVDTVSCTTNAKAKLHFVWLGQAQTRALYNGKEMTPHILWNAYRYSNHGRVQLIKFRQIALDFLSEK